MKKAFIIGTMIAMALSSAIYAQGAAEIYSAMDPQENIPPITFRNLEWGATKEEVREAVLADGINESNYSYNQDETMAIASSYRVAGLNMDAVYMFDENDQLYTALYDVKEEHVDDQQYYLDFLDLQEKLTMVYGEPTLVDDFCLDDYYMEDESEYGFNISAGELVFSRGWKASDGSAVVLKIFGDNFEIHTYIYYVSPEAPIPTPDTDGL